MASKSKQRSLGSDQQKLLRCSVFWCLQTEEVKHALPNLLKVSSRTGVRYTALCRFSERGPRRTGLAGQDTDSTRPEWYYMKEVKTVRFLSVRVPSLCVGMVRGWKSAQGARLLINSTVWSKTHGRGTVET